MLTAPHSILIDAPAGKLEVDALWHADQPQGTAARVALLCHPNPVEQGTMMNKVVTTMYRFARDAGMHMVRFNFRGVGRSTGSYGHMTGEIDDALAVLRWIGQQTDARKLWLGGFSFGGYVALRTAEHVAEDDEFADFGLTDLALIAPSIEKHPTDDVRLPADKTFLIYGENDELVAPDALAAFGERFGIRARVFADTGHFFHGKLGELKTTLEALSSTD